MDQLDVSESLEEEVSGVAVSGVAWARLSKDLHVAAQHLTMEEVRFLVDTYYQVQQFRIEAAGQARSAKQAGEPAAFTTWIAHSMRTVERSITTALDHYTETRVEGRWAKSLVGIGPVLSASLLAHAPVQRWVEDEETGERELKQFPTAGQLWSLAGLNPQTVWEKGQKRPWNARLKVLCWKIGESFVKTQNLEGAVYGPLYAERKVLERERNEAGAFAAQAAAMLTKKNFRKDTRAKAAYLAGRLPDAHLHARARRYAVKLFLAHWHHVCWEVATGQPPVKPYVLEHGGHAHYLAPPNWPMK